MARDIRVRISGDSGDLVRAAAAAGIALEVLNHDAAKSSRAMGALERDLGDAGRGAHNFGRAMDDATVASERAGIDILKTGQLIDQTALFMEGAATDAENLAGAMGGGGGGGAGLSAVMSASVPIFGSVGIAIAALPILIFAAVTAVNALVFAFGSLVAVVADLVAPVSLVAGLLGGLGLGFVLAAKRAAQGGGALTEFKNKLDTLKSMFGKTTDILAHAFLPILDKLAGAAEKALLFIDKLAREPLNKAFHDMATQGVTMLTHFMEQAGHILAKPFRLAVQLAFGTGPAGSTIANAVSNLWNQFTSFLFGYTSRHPVELRPGVFKIQARTVDGALQPFLDWFGRHKFTKQGIEIGKDLETAFKKSGAAQAMGKFLEQILIAAAKQTWNQFVALFFAAKHRINAAGQQLDHDIAEGIKHAAEDAWNWFKSKATAAIHAITHAFSSVNSAISAIKSIASTFLGILHKIGSFLAQPFSLHINFPSPPGWLTTLMGGIGSVVGGGGGGGTTGKTPPTTFHPGIATANVTQVHVHYHAPVIGEAAVNATIQKALRANARAGNASLTGGLVLR